MGPEVNTQADQWLTVVSAGRFQGATWRIGASPIVVGRGTDADVQVDDPAVSRRHARFELFGGRTMVTDLGSTAGTTVNQRAVLAPTELRDGDEVRLATLVMQFRAAPGAGESRQASFAVDQQRAHQLNNVGGDQYNHYLQTVHAQRDGFLREVAATRSHARGFVWIGLLLFVVGIGVMVTAMVQDFSDSEPLASTFEEHQQQTDDLFGPKVGDVPIVIIGWAMGASGLLMMKIGAVLHVVATARRRRVERDVVPVPPSEFHHQQFH